jgi:uncharacterized protein YuzE
MIKITFDKEADAIYIYFTEIGVAGVNRTYLCDPKENDGMINLDFDQNDRLVGIEILDASKKLPQDLLDHAVRIDKTE